MKRIVILGGGESGVGAAVLAKEKGFSVFLSDNGVIDEKYKNVLLHHDIAFEEKIHSEDSILKADEIIKSPGIPDTAALILAAKNKGVPVISEIEFACRYTNAKLIGITGSNGKTTTTSLTYHILKKAGLNVGLAGNIGESLAKQVAENDKDIYVIELSSFQLDGMFETKLDIAILLNITSDHLDRYDYKIENYINSKFRIIQNQEETDYFIYNSDDEIISKAIKEKEIRVKKIPFSIKEKLEEGACLINNQLSITINQKTESMSIHSLALQGKHNLYNSMASGIAARILELRKDIVRESMSDFENMEHRLEHVANVYGIEFINDSKATNVNSTWYALESIRKPIVWIAGGVDKGNDYRQLEDLVKEKVKAIVCLGKDNDAIHQAFGGIVENIVDADSARAAVNLAYQFGRKDDVVLLSPACASFDLFENYEDRGRQFKNAVKML